MKRSRQSVPAGETGAAGTDGQGQGIAWINKGGRNATTNQARRAAGQLAPKPSGGAAMLGNDRPSHPTMGSMGRVKNAGSSPSGYVPTAGSFNPPINNAMANLTGQATGQNEMLPRGNSAGISPKTRTPVTGNPVASKKPKTRAALAFYGE